MSAPEVPRARHSRWTTGTAPAAPRPDAARRGAASASAARRVRASIGRPPAAAPERQRTRQAAPHEPSAPRQGIDGPPARGRLNPPSRLSPALAFYQRLYKGFWRSLWPNVTNLSSLLKLPQLRVYGAESGGEETRPHEQA